MAEESETKVENPESAVIVESEDVNIWELSTEPHLDRIYNNLLGKSETAEGTWEVNDKLPKIMNEIGASEFIAELRARFNINMQMSELTEEQIDEIASNAGEIFADKLEDYWEEWNVKPSKSNFSSIAWQLVDQLRIFLRIAKNGGMKTHREKRGIKNLINPATGGAY